MKNSSLFNVIQESKLSPEEFGKLLGISGMSLRRWITKDAHAEVAKTYRPVIREAVYELLANGKLQASSASVQDLLTQSESFQTKAALKNLGISESFMEGSPSSDRMLNGLCQIGLQENKQEQVEANQNKIFSFKNLGDEWSKRISFLWGVIGSTQLSRVDKLVAFGALFYLLTPIDFVPDSIPFFGLLDDMAVLGIAVNYYMGKFQGLV